MSLEKYLKTYQVEAFRKLQIMRGQLEALSHDSCNIQTESVKKNSVQKDMVKIKEFKSAGKADAVFVPKPLRKKRTKSGSIAKIKSYIESKQAGALTIRHNFINNTVIM